MAVLITGAGLVGSLTAAKLVEKGERPVLYDVAPPMDHLATMVDLSRVKVVAGDILDLPELLRVIKAENIDRIIHTAGLLLAGVKARPYTGIKINIDGTVTVLEAARLMDIKRVVFTSSATVVYGLFNAPAKAPYEEDFTMRCLSLSLPNLGRE